MELINGCILSLSLREGTTTIVHKVCCDCRVHVCSVNLCILLIRLCVGGGGVGWLLVCVGVHLVCVGGWGIVCVCCFVR